MAHSNTLRKILTETDAVVVLDGGLATELERKGCDISSKLWSAEVLINKPTLIQDVHLSYYNAGADVAITASYQASALGLLEHDPSMTQAKALELIQDSVNLANNARIAAKDGGVSRDLYIAGSVGPYGAYLADGSEYRGDYSLGDQAMADFHRPRISALVAAGVDVLAFETIPSYEEAAVLLQLLKMHADTCAWFSFTLKNEDHISDGTPLHKVVDLIGNSEQVVAIGVNCVPEHLVVGALRTLRSLTSKALVAYPNSGEVYDATTKTWGGQHSQGADLKDKAQNWYKLGARLVGGCCRTTPDSIYTINEALRLK
ncbi:uncharacterized protein PV09_02486 [Verruconis gallopava]|uniref:Hcy-binding domain-containing protein n=1 Tax=Verruconis gallopava TaxID=253628 RepID=A0A0D1XVG4_9PEZI|nr:uncharacterized protein PV09_02486 [Verruconis gallopava]KIW06806.1 hypothetical protein PV09_02486 [Verruconis gallopava]